MRHFSCDASQNKNKNKNKKQQCLVPACEAFPSKRRPDMVVKRNMESSDVWNSQQLNRAPGNHPRSQVLKMERCLNLKCGEKRQKKLSVFRARMWHLNKTGENVCTPSMVLTTGPHRDERGTVRFRLWKNLCALTEGVYWEADWKWCTFFLLHSSLNNLLIFKIYMQRRKRYPFWNNRPIKPIFLQLYKFFFFFKTRLVSLSHVMLRRHLQISTG